MAINLPGGIKAGGGNGNMWDESTGPLIGRYIKRRSSVGPNNSNVYTLKPDGGEEIGVWGSTVIDGRFSEIPVGSLVGIEYVGKVKSQSGRSEYKDYDIEYVPPEGWYGVNEGLNEPKSDDVVIKDLDPNKNINLDDIPF